MLNEGDSVEAVGAELRRRPVAGAFAGSGGDAASLVFVDFDHTLLRGNSTELFIASCRPSFLVAALEFLVRGCVPWRFTGLPQWFRLRDFCCWLAISVLLPWNSAAWRRNAPGTFLRLRNRDVEDELAGIDAERIVIVTFGMESVVRALLRGSRWERCRLVATPPHPAPSHFRLGKLALLARRFSSADIRRSTVITDSLDDADILRAARRGVLIEPQGTTFQAKQALYVPLRYTAVVKYPRSYVLDQILLVDAALLVIAFSHSYASLLSAALFVPLLTISRVCVYEVGYFENDMFAAGREDAPTLSENVERFRSYPIEPAAWIWAIVTGALGVIVAQETGAALRLDVASSMVVWTAALLLLRLTFFCYNRLQPKTRALVYPLLQAFKYVPLFLLVPPTAVGLTLILAQVVTMATIYLAYRFNGDPQRIKREMLRTILFAVSAPVVLVVVPAADAEQGFALALALVWSAARVAKPSVMDALRGGKRAVASYKP